MVGETAFPSPSEQSGATARPWGGRLVGMGTKKADRSSISKLEIGSETVMGDSRSAQNPKEEEEEVEGARQRASGEGGKEGGRPQDSPSRSLSVRPPPTVSLCVCEPPPCLRLGGLGRRDRWGREGLPIPVSQL